MAAVPRGMSADVRGKYSMVPFPMADRGAQVTVWRGAAALMVRNTESIVGKLLCFQCIFVEKVFRGCNNETSRALWLNTVSSN